MKTLIRLKITAEEQDIELLWGMLALHISFGWEEESLPTGETLFTVHAESKEFIDKIIDDIRHKIPHIKIVIDEVASEDWTKAWREFFTPIECGKHFIVLPPWLSENTELNGRLPIIIEPKSAFGTGHHNTTALCLGVISELLETNAISKGMEFLDIGTGSGILGLGCALCGLFGKGVDIEIPSIENANENKILNSVPSYNATQKQGFDIALGSIELVQGQNFDLVLANILAAPLKDLAKDIVPLVKDNGYLVLSGILEIQAKDVESAYTACGLKPARLVIDGDWAALVFKKS